MLCVYLFVFVGWLVDLRVCCFAVSLLLLFFEVCCFDVLVFRWFAVSLFFFPLFRCAFACLFLLVGWLFCVCVDLLFCMHVCVFACLIAVALLRVCCCVVVVLFCCRVFFWFAVALCLLFR